MRKLFFFSLFFVALFFVVTPTQVFAVEDSCQCSYRVEQAERSGFPVGRCVNNAKEIQPIDFSLNVSHGTIFDNVDVNKACRFLESRSYPYTGDSAPIVNNTSTCSAVSLTQAVVVGYDTGSATEEVDAIITVSCTSVDSGAGSGDAGGDAGGGGSINGSDQRVFLVNPILGTDDNPSGTVDIPTILGKLVYAALGILGGVTLLVFVYGGFVWLTSAGNPERVKMGMKTILYAVIGLFIIFASYGILSAVLGGLTGGL